jgi:hypothetical protein
MNARLNVIIVLLVIIAFFLSAQVVGGWVAAHRAKVAAAEAQRASRCETWAHEIELAEAGNDYFLQNIQSDLWKKLIRQDCTESAGELELKAKKIVNDKQVAAARRDQAANEQKVRRARIAAQEAKQYAADREKDAQTWKNRISCETFHYMWDDETGCHYKPGNGE